MDEKDTRGKEGPTMGRRWAASAALVGAGALAGGVLAGAQVAGAEGTTSETEVEAPAADRMGHDPADLTHGPGEELLTGSTATDVEAAALAAVPGGTIIRVETDNEGAAYEAHVETSNGSVVTVKLDEDLDVIQTIDGFAARPEPSAPSDDSDA